MKGDREVKNADVSIHNTGITKEEFDGLGDKFHHGLTKREYFAVMSMQGYIAGVFSDTDVIGLNPTEAAKEAIAYADALLDELER